MKLGGFVIHGNNRETLGRCLDSLRAVCDEVVAVDSCSTDGSADLVAARGVRRVELPWHGYGAARAAAAAALSDSDYLFYLDSDEWLEPKAIDALGAWKRSRPTAPAYTVRCNDWAVLEEARFIFRTHRRKRIVTRDSARWRAAMIVHEGLDAPAEPLAIDIEHRFATSLDERAHRNEKYALLWAIQAHAEGRRPKPAMLQRLAHFAKGALVERAAFRGGAPGLRLAWLVSRYHSRKYEYLVELHQGRYADLAELYRTGRYQDLFEQVPQHLRT